jgi:hypothetical protein
VNDPSINADIAERMLRGEPTGPPGLAELLAAASSELATEDLSGEETAVAAFREARSHELRRPHRRRLSALVSLKAALIGLLLILAGGVAVGVTSQHLPGPLGNKPSHGTRTPSTSRTNVTETSPRAPSRSTRASTPAQHDEHAEHPEKTAHPQKHSEPAKEPKSIKPHKPGRTRSIPVPSTGSTRSKGPAPNSTRRPLPPGNTSRT